VIDSRYFALGTSGTASQLLWPKTLKPTNSQNEFWPKPLYQWGVPQPQIYDTVRIVLVDGLLDPVRFRVKFPEQPVVGGQASGSAEGIAGLELLECDEPVNPPSPREAFQNSLEAYWQAVLPAIRAVADTVTLALGSRLSKDPSWSAKTALAKLLGLCHLDTKASRFREYNYGSSR